MKANLKSTRTTGFGLLGLIPIVSSVISQLTDGNALTNPDWNTVIPAVAACFGLIMAKDGDKSSEDVA